jgi:hypothetical protein
MKNKNNQSQWGFTTLNYTPSLKSKISKNIGIGVASLGLAITLISGGVYWEKEASYAIQSETAQELIGLTQSVAKNALRAGQGDKTAIANLEENNIRFTSQLSSLRGSVSDGVMSNVLKMDNDWGVASKSIKNIIVSKGELVTLQSKLSKAEKDLLIMTKGMNSLQQVAKEVGSEARCN